MSRKEHTQAVKGEVIRLATHGFSVKNTQLVIRPGWAVEGSEGGERKIREAGERMSVKMVV